jgi:hypothetical protein
MSKALKHRWLASYQEQTKQQDPPQQLQQQQQEQSQAKQPVSAPQVMLLLSSGIAGNMLLPAYCFVII